MEVQKIVVTLDQPDLVIEPGNATRLVVTMTNQQPMPDRLLLEVEGIDIEWVNIPVSAVNVAPGATVSERINVKVTRSSENRAGSYPFLVRVVAMETGETGIAQAMLTVKPFDSLQLEMNPKRATATFMHPLNDFDITVANEGNAERNLELFASDPDDDCVYEFDADHVVLRPGQTQTVLMAARPKAGAWVGSPHLYSFQVSARSSEDRYVSAKTQGQIERRALVSPLAGLFLLLLTFGGIAYVALKPAPLTPVKLIRFAATPESVREGDPVTLTWDVSGDKPTIKLSHFTTIGGKDGTEVSDGLLDKPSGNAPFIPALPKTTYIITATGPSADSKVERRTVTVFVNAKPAAPKPVLTEFTADNTKVHINEQVVLSWKAKNASGYILDPGGVSLSSFMQTATVTPQYPGETKYILRALSVDKNAPPATREIKITAVSKDTSTADVVGFGPQKGTLYIGGTVHLKWGTRHAAGVRIDNDKGDIVGASLPPSGSIDVTLGAEPITYTLTAVDNLGNKAAPKQVKITPQPKPLPPPDPTPTPNAIKPDAGGTTNPNTPVPPADGALPSGTGGKTP